MIPVSTQPKASEVLFKDPIVIPVQAEEDQEGQRCAIGLVPPSAPSEAWFAGLEREARARAEEARLVRVAYRNVLLIAVIVLTCAYSAQALKPWAVSTFAPDHYETAAEPVGGNQ